VGRNALAGENGGDLVNAPTFTPAVRKAIPLLIGVAGGTGSGKTYSAMRLAHGLAGEVPFAVIDTENGRALHYADDFQFLHAPLEAPFRPSRYAEAIHAAAELAPVIVVDSTSHSWTGAGGVLEWHDELERGDAKRKMLAWQEPKADHRIFENELLQIHAHVILCFRAAPKVEMKRDEKGNMQVVPKEVIPGRGLDGWLPESDPRLPYEMTCSFLLMADAPGIPKPIKLPERLRALVPLDEQLSERTAVALGAWAAGTDPAPQSAASTPTADVPSPGTEPELLAQLTDLYAEVESSLSLAQVWAALCTERGVEAGDAPTWTEILASLTQDEAEALGVRLSDFKRKIREREGG
jgi:AAA domain